MTMIQGRDPNGGRVVVTHAGGIITEVQRDQGGDDLPWLAPGLVDAQINGFGGFDANGPDVTPDSIVGMREALSRVGTTTFVPTIITAADDDITASLRAIVAARKADRATEAAITHIHLEGPHLSERDGCRGAHPLDQIRPPDLGAFERWQAAAEGLLTFHTLSPHHPGTTEYVRALTTAGVRVAIGHTHASGPEIVAAVDAGARYSTHLGNGIQQLVDRHDNPIWTQLADTRLTPGFIADGHHLPDAILAAMIRAKGLKNCFVVSDAVSLAGMPPGRYVQPVGGTVELTTDGRLGTIGTPYLAGAALDLLPALGTLTRIGLSLTDALRLVTRNPGRIAAGRGRLEPGARADVITFTLEPGGRPQLVSAVQGGLPVSL